MSEAILCFSAGVPPTQLHKYGNLGCIDLAAVLEPLEFVLPQREILAPPPPASAAPELDIASELSSLTFETQLKEPATGQDLTEEAGSPALAPPPSGLRDPEERDEETIQDEDFSLE